MTHKGRKFMKLTDPEVTKMLELEGKMHLKVIITVYLKKN